MARPVIGTAALLIAAAAAAPLGAQEARPQTHTVKPGDTLWDLSRRYLGDPFLWPEIYRLNTMVVEDPHWIYPGEVLTLVAREPVAAVPSRDTPIPDAAIDSAAARQNEAAPLPEPVALGDSVPADEEEDPASRFSLAISRSALPADSLRLRPDPTMPVNSVVAGDFRSASFLEEDGLGATGSVLGPVLPRQIGATGATRQTMLIGTDIVVSPPRGGTYQVGDSLGIYTYDGKKIHPYGEIILPTGVAVIREQATTDRYVARVVKMYGEIHRGHMLLPLEPFSPVEADDAQPGEGVRGEIVGWPEFERLKGLNDQLLMNRGTSDGVQIGDLFEIRRPIDDDRGVLVPVVVGRGRVVHVGQNTATLKVVLVTGPDIPVGSETVQIAKMP